MEPPRLPKIAGIRQSREARAPCVSDWLRATSVQVLLLEKKRELDDELRGEDTKHLLSESEAVF